MGLLCGSKVFRKGGIFNILKPQRVIFQNQLEKHLPIFYAVDVMCELTALRGIEECTVSTMLDKWLVPGTKRKSPDISCENSHRPCQLAEALFRPLEMFVRCHSHTSVTVGLMCDVQAKVPVEKHKLQRLRAQKRSVESYDVNSQTCIITDDGLIIGDCLPQKVNMLKLMCTRSLRSELYRYLRAYLQKRVWSVDFTLIFDADFPVIGQTAFSYEIKSKEIPTETVIPHSDVGEGEISAMKWALRYKDTHSVQLHSGDLDMLALLLIHGHRFTYPVRALLCKRYVADYLNIKDILESKSFTLEDVIVGSLMLGTDFVSKKEVSHRCNPQVAFYTARSWRLISQVPVQQRLENCNLEKLSRILTCSNGVFKEKKETATPVHSQIIRKLEVGDYQKHKVYITPVGLDQLTFNYNYWMNLSSI
jgi:hypothetical protein